MILLSSVSSNSLAVLAKEKACKVEPHGVFILDKQLQAHTYSFPVIQYWYWNRMSQKGWGVQCMEPAQGCWSQYHINYLELLAAFLALKTFASSQKGMVLLKMDNISAVTCVHQPKRAYTFNTVNPAD